MVTNKSQSDSSFCVIINIFENKGLFMMHKKIRNKDYYIFILTEICGGGYTYADIMQTLCVFEKRKNKCFIYNTLSNVYEVKFMK